MSRNYIGVAPRGNNVLRGLRRDSDRHPVLIINGSTISEIVVDFQSFLDEDEKIAGSAIQATRVTASITYSDTEVLLTVEAPRGRGYVDLQVTLSNGRVWYDTINVRNQIGYVSDVRQALEVHIFYPIPATANIVFAGQMALVLAEKLLKPVNASLIVAGQVPTLVTDQFLVPVNDMLLVAGQVPLLAISQILAPVNDILVVAGQPPVLMIDQVLLPANASMLVTAQTPILVLDQVPAPANDVLAVTGRMPDLIIDQIPLPANGVLTITGHEPDVLINALWVPTDNNAYLWVNSFGLGAVSDTANVVTTLNDLTGNGRDMVAFGSPPTNAETINSRNVIKCDGAVDYFEVLDNGVDATNIFVFAVRVDVIDGSDSDTLFNMDNAGGGNDLQIDNGGTPLTDYKPRLRHSNLGISTSTASTDIAGSLAIVSVVLDAANSTGNLWINGTQEGAGTGYNGSLNQSEISLFVNRAGDRKHEGTFAELVIFSGTASDLIREKAEGYIAHGWGLEGSLPALHPYFAEPPIIQGAILKPANDALEVAGQAPTLVLDQIQAPANDVLLVAGLVPTLAIGQIQVPVNAALAIAGQVPTLAIDQVLLPANGLLAITGHVPDADSTFIPPELANLSLWLDASDDSTITHAANVVSQIDDKSVFLNHAVQATPADQPTYVDSGDFISFNGTYHIETPFDVSGRPALTVAMLFKMYNFPVLLGEFIHQFTGFGGLGIAVDVNGDLLVRVGATSGGSLRVLAVNSALVANEDFLFVVTFGSSGIEVFVNGVALPSEVDSDDIGTIAATGETFTIGGASDGSNEVDIDFNALIIYDDELNQDDRYKVEGYLTHHFGKTALLPFDHPYKDISPATDTTHLVAETATLLVAGQSPTLVLDQFLVSASAILVVSGQVPTLIISQVVVPANGLLTITGHEPDVEAIKSALFLPTDFANTTLWLDMSDDATVMHSANAISQIDDKSPFLNHAVQANAADRPIYDDVENRAIFSGSNMTSTFDSGDKSEMTGLILLRMNDLAVAGNANIVVQDMIGDGLSLFYSSDGNLQLQIRVTDTDTFRFVEHEGVLVEDNDILFVFQFGTNGLEGFINGEPIASDFELDDVISTTSSSNFIGIGGDYLGNDEAEISIYTLICVDEDLHQDDRYKLEGWACHTFGKTSLLPVTHPYVDNAPLADTILLIPEVENIEKTTYIPTVVIEQVLKSDP